MKLNIIKAGTFIKDNFGFVVITMLVIIIMLQNCDRTIEMAEPTVRIDTVIKEVKGDIIRIPTIIKTIPGKTEVSYIPDPNYDKLLIQYNNLVSDHTAKNISVDTIKINNNGITGFLRLEDTINKNVIIGRKASYNFNYPIVTKTITEPAPKKTQLYFGGGLGSGNGMVVDRFNVGLLLKTKNDKIYNVYAGPTINGNITVGVQAYWKIKLGK